VGDAAAHRATVVVLTLQTLAVLADFATVHYFDL
jgi:hypothetical protein